MMKIIDNITDTAINNLCIAITEAARALKLTNAIVDKMEIPYRETVTKLEEAEEAYKLNPTDETSEAWDRAFEAYDRAFLAREVVVDKRGKLDDLHSELLEAFNKYIEE